MPKGRKYLPYGLTKKEKRSPKLRRKLSSCIKKVEKKACPKSAKRKDGTYDYEKCMANPVRVCRVSVGGVKRIKKSKKKKRDNPKNEKKPYIYARAGGIDKGSKVRKLLLTPIEEKRAIKRWEKIMKKK